jgi:phosphoadenylyl-sulfate reductase (thioredoxin)
MSGFAALQKGSAHDVLAWAINTFEDRFAVLTSFQLEGMVVLDIAARISPSVRVITLDTGRLPPATFDIMERARERYGVRIETVLPDAAEVERMVSRFGPNLFYESVAYRNLCCQVRKVRPLERKLEELEAYAVGLRREQAATRGDTQKIAESNGRLKISPLSDWTAEDVAAYARDHDVLRHPLYEKGYTSIGCAPCTRATTAGEDERAGRWWWEAGDTKECGLHFTPEGRVERTLDVLLRDITGTAPSSEAAVRS